MTLPARKVRFEPVTRTRPRMFAGHEAHVSKKAVAVSGRGCTRLSTRWSMRCSPSRYQKNALYCSI